MKRLSWHSLAPYLYLAPFVFIAHAASGGTVVGWPASGGGVTNAPPDLTNIVAVSAGLSFSLLLGNDGTVSAWGNDNQGETDINGARSISAISAGGAFVLSIDNSGSVNVSGGQNWGVGSPDVPQPDLTGTIGIAAGTYHNMVLKADGTVAAWGNNYYGQCNAPADLTNAVAVAVSRWYSSAALRADGTVRAWGNNPVKPPAGLSNVVAISCGDQHLLALKADGTVVAWGSNTYGQSNVPAGLSNVVAIAAGIGFNLVLKGDGTLAAWGALTTTDLPPGLTNVIAISAFDHVLALVGDGPPLISVPVTGATWSNGSFTASFATEYNHVYALQYTDSLSTPNWTTLPLNPGNGGLVAVSDPTATGAQRFYRVRRW